VACPPRCMLAPPHLMPPLMFIVVAILLASSSSCGSDSAQPRGRAFIAFLIAVDSKVVSNYPATNESICLHGLWCPRALTGQAFPLPRFAWHKPEKAPQPHEVEALGLAPHQSAWPTSRISTNGCRRSRRGGGRVDCDIRRRRPAISGWRGGHGSTHGISRDARGGYGSPHRNALDATASCISGRARPNAAPKGGPCKRSFQAGRHPSGQQLFYPSISQAQRPSTAGGANAAAAAGKLHQADISWRGCQVREPSANTASLHSHTAAATALTWSPSPTSCTTSSCTSSSPLTPP